MLSGAQHREWGGGVWRSGVVPSCLRCAARHRHRVSAPAALSTSGRASLSRPSASTLRRRQAPLRLLRPSHRRTAVALRLGGGRIQLSADPKLRRAIASPLPPAIAPRRRPRASRRVSRRKARHRPHGWRRNSGALRRRRGVEEKGRGWRGLGFALRAARERGRRGGQKI